MDIQDRERAALEEDREDRISGLPRNVLDCIVALLPAHDAARTSILSKKWRYIWAMLPNLVLDKLFCKKLAGKSKYDFDRTIDKILLQHLGEIVEFVLDVSHAHLSSDSNIDGWMLYVSRNGVRELTLNMSKESTYKLPSYIFNCPTLTHLELFNCVFKPPNSFLGFQNVKTLLLDRITFVPTTEFCVIKAPLLVNLTLRYCRGNQYLKIVSSLLKSLTVHQSHHDLNCFVNCKTLRVLFLVADNPKHDERSNLEKLFSSFPTLEVLTLGPFELEILSAGTVSKELHINLNCLSHLKLGVDFGKVGQTTYALELIKSSPNMRKLELWVSATTNSAEAAMKYLESPACLDRPLNKLEVVIIHFFKGSKTELVFVRLLCARSPSLVRMSIKQARAFTDERNITAELIRFPRASPKAELFYLPYAD